MSHVHVIRTTRPEATEYAPYYGGYVGHDGEQAQIVIGEAAERVASIHVQQADHARVGLQWHGDEGSHALQHDGLGICGLGTFERLVQIRHISCMMLIVMDFHRLRIDMRHQRIKRVGQLGQRKTGGCRFFGKGHR